MPSVVWHPYRRSYLFDVVVAGCLGGVAALGLVIGGDPEFSRSGRPRGELPLWEAAAGLALVLLAIVVAVRVAARVYTGAALHVRGQLKLRQAIAR